MNDNNNIRAKHPAFVYRFGGKLHRLDGDGDGENDETMQTRKILCAYLLRAIIITQCYLQ